MDRFDKNNYYKAAEVLYVLRVDEDSDEEDFDKEESDPISQETKQESDKKNHKQEIEDVDTELSSLSQTENLLGFTTTDGSIVPQQSQIFSRDSAIWNKKP